MTLHHVPGADLFIFDAASLFALDADPVRLQLARYDWFAGPRLALLVDQKQADKDSRSRLLDLLPGDYSAYQHSRWSLFGPTPGQEVHDFPAPGLLWEAMLWADALPAHTLVVSDDDLMAQAGGRAHLVVMRPADFFNLEETL